MNIKCIPTHHYAVQKLNQKYTQMASKYDLFLRTQHNRQVKNQLLKAEFCIPKKLCAALDLCVRECGWVGAQVCISLGGTLMRLRH